MAKQCPAVFIFNGAPLTVINGGTARDVLPCIGTALREPTAIPMDSTHWETDHFTVSTEIKHHKIITLEEFSEALNDANWRTENAMTLAAGVARLESWTLCVRLS
jgi:aromatic ring-opening dioxygenase catalytic subunit (LigB family)